jgi:hypothetical protein
MSNPAYSFRMDLEKKARLESQGWRVGSAEELLGLSPEEAAYVKLRLKLSDAVREPIKNRSVGPEFRPERATFE